MSMTKRLQIPISQAEERLLKTAAKRSGLSLAEWARRLLRERAKEEFMHEKLSPKQSLKALSEINASIDSVDVMIKQSFESRYK